MQVPHQQVTLNFFKTQKPLEKIWESNKMNNLKEIQKEMSCSGSGPLKADALHAVLSIRKNQLKNNEIDSNTFKDHMDFVQNSSSFDRPKATKSSPDLRKRKMNQDEPPQKFVRKMPSVLNKSEIVVKEAPLIENPKGPSESEIRQSIRI
jgi:hypothetical protein